MILPYQHLEIFLDSIKMFNRLVVTNGCFDILHHGHVRYLQDARRLGDILLVGVNSDSAVKKLKGKNRPINGEYQRALVINALKFVDYVCIFPDKTALNFLKKCEPEIYVKGGDYDVESINQDERRYLESIKCKIKFLSFDPSFSTTDILGKLEKDFQMEKKGFHIKS